MSRRKPGERDYRDLKTDGEKPRDDRLPQGYSRRWWELKGTDAAHSIIGTVSQLQRVQAPRLRQHIISARLYGNVGVLGASAQALARLMASTSAAKDRMTFNAIGSIVDTLTARVGTERPRPYYLTSGGSYAQQRKAKKLNQFTEGVFYETKTYETGLRCFRDGAVWGDGLMHVYGHAGKLRHERVLCSELWVDEVEAMLGNPRNMFRVKDVDRDELCAYFSDDPAAVKAIESASRVLDLGARGNNASDLVRIIEAWHLAAENEDGKLVGGKHGFIIDGGSESAVALLGNDGQLDDWPYDFFPFAKLPWCERPVGYWSQGLAEQLQGEQLELNKELFFIQRSLHMAGTVKVFVKVGSKIVNEHISNEVGAIIEHTGDAPVFFVPQPIHPLYLENVNQLIQRMYQQSGASEMSATGKKPAGLNSGRALREAQDIESDRYRTISRQNDNFYLSVAHLDAVFAKELRGYSVKVPGRNAFSRIDFKKDIGDVDEDDFIRQCFPVSRLPRDPAGRLDTIQEYIQAGFMSPRQGRRALDFPDLDTIESLANAQEDLLTMTLDAMLDEGRYRPPEPTDDLPLAKELVLEYLQRYRQYDDAEYEKLDMLRRFSSQVDTLMKRAMGPALTALPGGAAPGSGGAPGTVPQGRPNQAPISELMPQRAA